MLNLAKKDFFDVWLDVWFDVWFDVGYDLTSRFYPRFTQNPARLVVALTKQRDRGTQRCCRDRSHGMRACSGPNSLKRTLASQKTFTAHFDTPDFLVLRHHRNEQ